MQILDESTAFVNRGGSEHAFFGNAAPWGPDFLKMICLVARAGGLEVVSAKVTGALKRSGPGGRRQAPRKGALSVEFGGYDIEVEIHQGAIICCFPIGDPVGASGDLVNGADVLDG